MNNHRRIVLCLQYWEGDREQAMRNARRIADNEPNFRDDFEFCFVARFDCAHDQETIDYVSKKFFVSKYTGTRRGKGWPFGCNDVWTDLMQESYRRVRSGEWAQVRALFTFEADCVPVHSDWLSRLTAEWTATELEGKWLTGWHSEHPGPVGHMNGNLMCHPFLFNFLPQIVGCSADIAWDCAFAPVFQSHWRPARFLENLYAQKDVPVEAICGIVKSGVVLIHGVKDKTVEDFADGALRKL